MSAKDGLDHQTRDPFCINDVLHSTLIGRIITSINVSDCGLMFLINTDGGASFLVRFEVTPDTASAWVEEFSAPNMPARIMDVTEFRSHSTIRARHSGDGVDRGKTVDLICKTYAYTVETTNDEFYIDYRCEHTMDITPHGRIVWDNAIMHKRLVEKTKWAALENRHQ